MVATPGKDRELTSRDMPEERKVFFRTREITKKAEEGAAPLSSTSFKKKKWVTWVGEGETKRGKRKKGACWLQKGKKEPKRFRCAPTGGKGGTGGEPSF